MALFSSPTYSTMMHHSQNGDSSSGVPLAHAIPSAHTCTISGLIAFPSSLAALKHGIKWNASCWVANQRLNEFEQDQIALHAFRGEQRIPHIEWCQFATSLDDTISMLIVFPQLKMGFRTVEIMERWTDHVVLPAFRTVGITDGTLTSSFKVIQMTAEAEREQTLNTFAPDTTLMEVLARPGGLSSQGAHDLWAAMQENANRTVFFDGFKGLFLVAVNRVSGVPLRSLPMVDAWREVAITWDKSIDMTFVPIDSVRANTSATISAQSVSCEATTLQHNGDAQQHRTTADSLWESSRKRRLDNDEEVGKRSKLGYFSSTTPPQDDTDMAM